MKLFVPVFVVWVQLGLAQTAGTLVPGQNINMVSGTTFPDGDPFLQRQNEPSLAVSSRNPLHILAGANDYRAVDLPTSPAASNTADAWLGVFKSLDGGNTWKSTLHPGCPQNVPACSSSPLKGFQAGADPVVRAGTNGMFYYLGLAFNRAAGGLSTIFVSRFIDNNNSEINDPIQFLDTVRIANGTAEVFVDKPWMAVDIPRAGALTCTVNGQQFPGGNIYVVYSAFRGLNNEPQDVRSTLFATRSRDCGANWSTPVAITDGQSLAQGAQLAIDPNTGAIWVVWRQFALGGKTNAILVSRSTDAGVTFSAPYKIADIDPFDQGSTSVSFRTNSYPTIAMDGSTPNARAYVAWTQRTPSTSDDGRIVITSSTDGATWTTPSIAESFVGRGHQVMPALVFAGGRLALLYYDQRETQTTGAMRCPTGSCATPADFAETRPLSGDLALGQITKVFNRQLADAAPPDFNPATNPLLRRQTLDVRISFASPGPNPSFTSNRVSRYSFGSPSGGARQSKPINQIRYNAPNIPLFVGGSRAFIGDYLDLAPSPSFVPVLSGTRTIWRHNTSPNTPTTFHAAWTDNRDVIPPRDGDWTKYTPPKVVSSSVFDSTVSTPSCEADRTGMRNQNIYTSRISTGLFVGSPTNAKPLSTSYQRSFIVFVQNQTDLIKHYRISLPSTILAGGSASLASGTTLAQLDVSIAPRSSVVRTVYARSSDPGARITVNVNEIVAPGGALVVGGLSGSMVFNADTTNPALISPPPAGTGGIREGEFFNPDLTNPDLTNPDLTNPDLTNPDLTNPDLTNPDLTNPDLTNPDLTNPGAANPDLTNPVIANPDLTNPDLTNPDLTNNVLTDATYRITNRGNTAAPYTIRFVKRSEPPTGTKFQLVVYKVYKTPATKTCSLGEIVQNQLVANIRNPRLLSPNEASNPDLTNPDLTNATLYLEPGQEARVTLRILAPTRQIAEQIVTDTVQPTVASQAPNVVPNQAPQNPPATIVIANAGLPDGFRGASYNTQLTGIGGTGAFTWSVTSGQLPPGLTLNAASGVISGNASTAGSFTFAIGVRDAANPPATGSRFFTIRIGSELAIVTPATLPNMKIGVTPSTVLQALGGTGNLFWSFASGQLPAGVVLNANGTFSGSPTVTGVFSFVARVVDSAATPLSRQQQFSVEVLPTPFLLSVSPSSAVQGTTVDVEITGQYTTFEQGASVVLAGAGIQSTSVTVESPTRLRATLSVPANEPLGVSDLRVETRTESPRRRNIFNTLARPRILAVTPLAVRRSQTTTVDITGAGTNWQPGLVSVSFSGAGVTVTGVQVVSRTLLRVTLTIAPSAELSARSVTYTAGAATDTLNNAIVIADAIGEIRGVVKVGATPSPGAFVRLYHGNPLQPIAVAYANVLGAYEFRGVPAGPYRVFALDALGTRVGSVDGVIVTSGQQMNQDLILGGTSTIVATVLTQEGLAVSGAEVRVDPDLSAVPAEISSEFSFTARATSDALGRATFNGVPSLPIEVSAYDAAITMGGSTRSLGPVASGNVLIDVRLTRPDAMANPVSAFAGTLDPDALPTGFNELVSPVVSVQAGVAAPASGGTVTGTVYRAGGTVAASGVSVTVAGAGNFSRTVTTVADGSYSVAGVPVGSFTVSATDSATGDRGSGGSNQISAVGETRTINITLNGVGSLTINVRRSDNSLVANAAIRITAPFSTITNITAATGTTTVANVLAGSVRVDATDPANNQRGETTVSLAPGGAATANIVVAAAGVVRGTVVDNNGSTPIAGGRVVAVRCSFSCVSYQTANTEADGSYRFAALPVNSYFRLDAYDQFGVRRATTAADIVPSLTIETVRNFTLAPAGTVTGIVRNPDSSPAANINVNISGSNNNFPVNLSVRTDAQGAYTFGGVTVGDFRISAGDSTRNLLGEASGRINAHGETLTINITLLNNSVNLPQSLSDANGFGYQARQNGTQWVNNSQFTTLNQLSLILNNASTTFQGQTVGLFEDERREYTARQPSLAGLEVSRKMFVPTNGYFMRYLEVLRNPTSAPITVGVRVSSSAQFGGTRVTSSGDEVLSTADQDRWLALERSDFAQSFVFDGPGANKRVDTLTQPSSSDALEWTWNSVTIPAGETRILMHFLVTQSDMPGAIASATRLEQLPPEALSGLSAEERAQILNFAVPATGVSTLPPLPALTGTITGKVTASDGVTPLQSVGISFQSADPIFHRVYTITATNATGDYSVTPQTFRTVPVGPFRITATLDSLSYVAQGEFPPGETAAVRNISFAGTGSLRGTVRTPQGQDVTGATIYVIGYPGGTITDYTGSGASFSFPVAVPGTYQIAASAYPNRQGVATATVMAGATTTVDVITDGLYTISGTVRTASGTIATSTYVEVFAHERVYNRAAYSGSTGTYAFSDLPPGNYTLRASLNNATASATLRITNQNATQDLTLSPLGQVQVLVTSFSGAAIANAQVAIRQGTSTSYITAGQTDANGRFTITNVPAGAFSIRATHPDSSRVVQTADGTVSANNQTVSITLIFPRLGSVNGTVTLPNGAPVTSGSVWVYESGAYIQTRQVDSLGRFTAPNLQLNAPISLTYSGARTGSAGPVTLTAASPDQILNIPLPALAQLTVIVNNGYQPFQSVLLLDRMGGWVDESNFAGDGTNGTALFYVDSSSSPFTVSTPDYLNATVSVLPSNDGQMLSVTLSRGGVTGPPLTTVSGRIVAADAVTPAIGYYLEIRDAATNSVLGYGYPGTDGRYSRNFPNVSPQGVIARVVGITPTLERTATPASPGGPITIDFTLPLSIIRGRMTHPDGQPTGSSARVTLNPGATGTVSASVAQDGNFTILTPLVGPFTLEGTDGLLRATVNGTVASANIPVAANIAMPASGAITGTVSDASGASVTNRTVYLTATGQSATNTSTSVDANGVYRFNRVPLGAFSVQTRLTGGSVTGAARIDSAGQTVTLNLRSPALGTVRGRVLTAGGIQLGASGTVTVRNLSHDGPAGLFTVQGTLSSGSFTVTDVPVGRIRVEVRTSNSLYAQAELDLTSTTIPSVDLVVSNLIQPPYSLLNYFGYRYRAYCDGRVDTTSDSDPYSSAYALTVGNTAFPCATTGTLEDQGQEVVFTGAVEGLQTTRKLYAPIQGSFVRMLDSFTNTGSTAVTRTIRFNGSFSYTGQIFRTPAETQNRYAVSDFGSGLDVGHIFAGAGASNPPASVQVQSFNTVYQWTLTVQPGQTVTLMHFSTVRFDPEQAAAQAEALANLTDPNALSGMTAQERAQVVNFRIP